MKKLGRGIRYLLLMCVILSILLVVNVLIFTGMRNTAKKGVQGAFSIDDLMKELSGRQPDYSISEKGKEKMEEVQGFAMVLAGSGDVVWEYQKPEEIPNHFSLTEAVAFSDKTNYPVYIGEMKDGNLLVVGMPKENMKVLFINEKRFNDVRCFWSVIIIIDLLILSILPYMILKKEAHKKELERTGWIAEVSHDIRTPLSLAMLYTGKIVDSSKEEESVQAAKMILKQEYRLRSLIENLNTESKLSYGCGNWKKEKIQLAVVIRDVLCGFTSHDDKELFEIDCNIAEDMEDFRITTDEGLLRRMLENILRNSILHNPDGCWICVDLRPSEQKNGCVLTIKDDGIGASEEVLEEINKKINPKNLPEHGLGLKVVKQIVQMNKWNIVFESEEGFGFSVRVEMV